MLFITVGLGMAHPREGTSIGQHHGQGAGTWFWPQLNWDLLCDLRQALPPLGLGVSMCPAHNLASPSVVF